MNTEQKADIKCNKCKTYRFPTDFLNDKNRTLKTCKKCREYGKKYKRSLCPHQRHKQNCVKCCPCPHQKIKRKCVECNPCPHQKLKQNCIECSPCPHNKVKSNCVECNPCPHNKVKSNCIECSPCPHNKLKKHCAECNPCPHNKVKSNCADCSPCPHQRIKLKCAECNPCPHNKLKFSCKKCNEPIKITIKNMIRNSKTKDKKYNRYDADRFIDKCFLEELIEEYPTCYYEDCGVELQYVEYQDNLATIERLDNTIGHIKSNCVLCCKRCNNLVKSNK